MSLRLTKNAQNALHATGMWAHTLPVERLAFDHQSRRLASGAHREIYVWELAHSSTQNDPQWVNVIDVATLYDIDDGEAPIVTGLHWVDIQSHQNVLLVAYLHEGIR